MKYLAIFLSMAALSVTAEEVKAPVTGAMVFKNGVSAVRRTVEPGKLTAFDLACDIQPIQGSLWFASPVISVVRQETKKPVAGIYPLSNITKTFAGKPVTLLVDQGNGAVREIAGTVWDPDPKPVKGRPVNLRNDELWLKRADGCYEMVRAHLIRGIRCAAEPKAAALPEQSDRRPVWHFTLAKPAEKPLWVDYLTKGLEWQSAYRIELGKEKKMTVSQDVEIVNNLADLNKVTLYLASGFANFVNQNSTSPMAMIQPEPGVQNVEGFHNVRFNNQAVMASDCMPMMAAGPRYGRMSKAGRFGTMATDESEDISLLPLPDFSLKKGEVCHKVIGSAETAYERLVHWTIRPRREAQYGRRTGADNESPMDALRFTNPFTVPMTTSPVEIRDGGTVLAQVKTEWVNPKQETTLDITRALSVTGKVVEYDVPAQKTDLAEQLFHSIERNKQGKTVSGWIAGSRYRITDVQGEIRLKNYRKLPARMQIELHYSGLFVSAEGNPKQTMQDRTSSVNPSAQLNWDLTLPAGAEKVIKYRYTLLVNF